MPGQKEAYRLYSSDGHALIDLLQLPGEDPPQVHYLLQLFPSGTCIYSTYQGRIPFRYIYLLLTIPLSYIYLLQLFPSGTYIYSSYSPQVYIFTPTFPFRYIYLLKLFPSGTMHIFTPTILLRYIYLLHLQGEDIPQVHIYFNLLQLPGEDSFSPNHLICITDLWTYNLYMDYDQVLRKLTLI